MYALIILFILILAAALSVCLRQRGRGEQWLRRQLASERRYRDLFASSRDAIMTLEPPSWKFTSSNPPTVELFGANNKEEFVSLGPWSVSPERQPDGRASAEKAKEIIETAMRETLLTLDRVLGSATNHRLGRRPAAQRITNQFDVITQEKPATGDHDARPR